MSWSGRQKALISVSHWKLVARPEKVCEQTQLHRFGQKEWGKSPACRENLTVLSFFFLFFLQSMYLESGKVPTAFSAAVTFPTASYGSCSHSSLARRSEKRSSQRPGTALPIPSSCKATNLDRLMGVWVQVLSRQHVPRNVNHTFSLAQLSPSSQRKHSRAFWSRRSAASPLFNWCPSLTALITQPGFWGRTVGCQQAKPWPFMPSDSLLDSASRGQCLLDLSAAINTPTSGLAVSGLLWALIAAQRGERAGWWETENEGRLLSVLIHIRMCSFRPTQQKFDRDTQST